MSDKPIHLVSSEPGDSNKDVRVVQINNEEQRGILLFEILGVEQYSSTQLMDAMRFIQKLMSYGASFREIITDVSLIMGNGEKFYELTIHES